MNKFMEHINFKHIVFGLLMSAFGFGACNEERKQSEYGEYFNTDASSTLPVSQKDSLITIETDSVYSVADSTTNI